MKIKPDNILSYEDWHTLKNGVAETIRDREIPVVNNLLEMWSNGWCLLSKVVGFNLQGLCYSDESGSNIWVDPFLGEEDTILTCIHEVTHATINKLNWEMELPNEEEICDQMEEYLYNHRSIRKSDRDYILSLF